MNEVVTYQWSEKLALAAMYAYQKTRHGKPWLFFVLGVLFLVTGAVLCMTEGMSVLGGIELFMGIFILARPIRTHFFYKREIKDSGRLLSDPTVTITLTDEDITLSSAASNRTIQWKHLTKINEVDSIVLLWSGKALASSFPSDPFSAAQIEFIKSRLHG